MSDSDHIRQSQSWRSKFRSRNHDAAHDQAEESAVDSGGREDVSGGRGTLIAKQEELEQLIGRLREAGSFAYDSEFIGELFYVPKLCVVQIATAGEVAIVDALAELDLRPLWELLADEGVEKIVHAGSQDMEPVIRRLGAVARNVVDTQIAAGFAGMAYPVSLQRLVREMVGVRLGKGLTFTHWDQRPLSAQQIRYAADDVRYLPAVWRELKREIEPAGTMDWVMAECRQMCAARPYQYDPETGYQKVRGAATLDGRQLGVLRELANWRDGLARETDLPARSVMKDEILVDLARRAPGSEEKLGNIQGLPRQVRIAHGGSLLEAIERGRGKVIAEGAVWRKVEETPRGQFKTDAILSVGQALCMSRGIDPQLVMSRSEVSELLFRLEHGKSIEECRLMQGWRRELIGAKLAELFREGGEVSLGVRQGQVVEPQRDGGENRIA